MPRFVSNPARQVTDPVMIKFLQSKGIDPNRIEFYRDYGPRKHESGPYQKFYRGLGMNQRFAVISGLPMVNYEGQRVQPLWSSMALNRYKAGVNQFAAELFNDAVEVTCINDQPTGIKKGDRLSWQPELTMGGLIGPSNMRLLPVDPTNPNYQNNVIAWDYGPNVIRRARLIEGRLHERWFIAVNPGTDIRIKHNAIGKGLKLGLCKDAKSNYIPVAVIGDEEIILAKDLAKAVFPILIGASATFNPDADPETSSVDGYVDEGTDTNNWATIRNAAGDNADSIDDNALMGWLCNAAGNQYSILWRIILLFDTSTLDDAAIISASTLSAFCHLIINSNGYSHAGNVYTASPASNTALVGGDYDSLGTTPLCDTPISQAIWDNDDYQDFALNGTGLAEVKVDAVSKFGMREVTYDVANNPPGFDASGGGRLYIYQADKGAGFKPKLVVEYSLPVGGSGMASLIEAGII